MSNKNIFKNVEIAIFESAFIVEQPIFDITSTKTLHYFTIFFLHQLYRAFSLLQSLLYVHIVFASYRDCGLFCLSFSAV